MKKNIMIVLGLFLCLILYGCGENTKVTFNYNCPGVSNYKCDVLDKKINCTFTMPQCKDKEFIGWYDKPVDGNRVNLDKDFEESTTLYAYWNDTEESVLTPEPEPVEETYYRMTFNANGGFGGQTDSVQVKYEDLLPEISKEKPIRENYEFMGWYDNSDYTIGKIYYDSECIGLGLYDIKGNIILYAGWKANEVVEGPDEDYIISFNVNGGTGGQYSDVYVTYGNELPSISIEKPIRSGYTFMGWYDNSDYTKGTRYYDGYCLPERNYDKKSDTILYAGWKANIYTITYDLNGGSNGQSGNLSAVPNSVLPVISKEIPTRSGYTFKGWYDNKDYTKGTQYYNEKNEAVRVYDKANNITLYAGWSKIVTVFKYTVKFNINNGTGTVPSDVTAILGNAMPTITTSVPSKSGYAFMGWYDNANYLNGTQYYTAQNKSARAYDRMSGITLYAGWKETASLKATCTGEYVDTIGNAKLSVNVTSGTATNYKFLIDGKIVQDSNSATYTADSEYVLLINPKVTIKSSSGQSTTITCSVKHSNYMAYNAKGYYFSAKHAKDKTGSVNNPYTSNRLPYYIHIPQNVSANEALPLIIGLHGGYGIGTCSNGKQQFVITEGTQTNHYFKNVYYYDMKNIYSINGGKDNDMKAVVLTISNNKCSWNGDMYGTMDIIHAIIKKYNIDLNHVVLTGVSQGGAGTLYLGFLEEQILYKAKDNDTTLSSVAAKYNTTIQAIESYNNKTHHSISYSNSSSKTLKSGSVTIIRSRNSDEPGSIFSLLMPFSPAHVDYRFGFVNVDGVGTPPHVLKTPIWVITSNDEYPKVQTMAQEVTKTYDKLGDVRYTVLTKLYDPHDSDTAFFNRTSAAKWVISATRGNVKVKNNSEIDAIEKQMGSNYAQTWRP